MSREPLAQEPLAEEYMSTQFLILQGDLTRDEIHHRLLEARFELGIVVDSQNNPVKLIGSSGFHPIKSGKDTSMRIIFDQWKGWIRDNKAGVVVVDKDQVVGIIPASGLQDYWMNQYPGSPKGTGDVTLGGTPKQSLLLLKCKTCGTFNELPDFDPGRTLCVNRHVLVPQYQ
jgi:hypothetical protein